MALSSETRSNVSHTHNYNTHLNREPFNKTVHTRPSITDRTRTKLHTSTQQFSNIIIEYLTHAPVAIQFSLHHLCRLNKNSSRIIQTNLNTLQKKMKQENVQDGNASSKQHSRIKESSTPLSYLFELVMENEKIVKIG